MFKRKVEIKTNKSVLIKCKDISDNYICKFLTENKKYQGFLTNDGKFIYVFDDRGILSQYSIQRFEILEG